MAPAETTRPRAAWSCWTISARSLSEESTTRRRASGKTTTDAISKPATRKYVVSFRPAWRSPPRWILHLRHGRDDTVKCFAGGRPGNPELVIRVTDTEVGTGTKDAEQFAYCLEGVGEELEELSNEDEVKALIAEGERTDVTFLEAN